MLLSTSPLTLTVPWSSWKEQAFIDKTPSVQRRNGTWPELHSCLACSVSVKKNQGGGQHEGSAAEATWAGVALSGDWAGSALASISRNLTTPGVCPRCGVGRAGPGHWHQWGQLEQTLIKLVNLSGPLAGNRQGASGRFFGVPLIVTMTLAPDVALLPAAGAAAWGTGQQA